MPKPQKGFTLIEVLITMVLVTLLSLLVLDMLAPWMLFRSKLETDRKIQEVKLAMTEAYKRNPMRIDEVNQPILTFDTGTFASSSVNTLPNGTRSCNENAGFDSLKMFLSNGPKDSQVDGFNSPFCVFISNRLSKPVDGATLYYHNIAIVSPGSDAVVSSTFDVATGELNVLSDDIGVLIDGYSIQYEKYKLTLDRMNKLSDLYSSYFTSRFLANPARDVSVNYFSKKWDTTGDVASTEGSEQPVREALALLGTNDIDSKTPYEDSGAYGNGRSNDIFVENYNKCIPLTETANCTSGSTTDCLCVRSPATGAIPPYTAIFTAKLPGGSQVTKSVVGLY